MRSRFCIAPSRRWSLHRRREVILRILKLVVVIVLCSACVDTYRTVGPSSKVYPGDQRGLVRLVYDRAYLAVLKNPTISGDSIVGTDELHDNRRVALPVARITRVEARERAFIDTLLSRHLGYRALTLPYGLIALDLR